MMPPTISACVDDTSPWGRLRASSRCAFSPSVVAMPMLIFPFFTDPSAYVTSSLSGTLLVPITARTSGCALKYFAARVFPCCLSSSSV